MFVWGLHPAVLRCCSGFCAVIWFLLIVLGTRWYQGSNLGPLCAKYMLHMMTVSWPWILSHLTLTTHVYFPATDLAGHSGLGLRTDMLIRIGPFPFCLGKSGKGVENWEGYLSPFMSALEKDSRSQGHCVHLSNMSFMLQPDLRLPRQRPQHLWCLLLLWLFLEHVLQRLQICTKQDPPQVPPHGG